MKKMFAICIFILVSFSSFAQEAKTDFPSEKIKKFKYDIGNGKIKITAGANSYIKAQKIKGDEFCKIISAMDNETLLLNSENTKNGPCEFHLEIQILENSFCGGRLGSGEIEIQNIKGVTDFRVGKGNVKILSAGKEVNGQTGNGNISVAGAINNANIFSGSGNIDLSVTNLPGKGEIELKTGHGNITVYALKDSSLRFTQKAGMGFMTSEILENPKATFTISMRSGTGHLRIKKLNP